MREGLGGDEGDSRGEAVDAIEVLDGREAPDVREEFGHVRGDEETALVDDGFEGRADAEELVDLGWLVYRDEAGLVGAEAALGFCMDEVREEGLHGVRLYPELFWGILITYLDELVKV